MVQANNEWKDSPRTAYLVECWGMIKRLVTALCQESGNKSDPAVHGIGTTGSGELGLFGERALGILALFAYMRTIELLQLYLIILYAFAASPGQKSDHFA
jgi:hypothetical protein